MPSLRKALSVVVIAFMAALLFAALAAAHPTAPGDPDTLPLTDAPDGSASLRAPTPLDRPATSAGQAADGAPRVLVILVEFGGTDTFTWRPGDTWDPLGRADPREAAVDEYRQVKAGDCSAIITGTRTFTYSGPRHNRIPRPVSAADRSGDTIWTEDFSEEWYEALLFGQGVKFEYAREDGSVVSEDFTGQSVRDYYLDMSGGKHALAGDVVGWVALPHSTQWYAADACPGRRSAEGVDIAHAGAIPGAGDERSFVADTLAAVDAISPTLPGFRWQNYDGDGDGLVDRLWIVHAGYGEDEDAALLNRTEYGESALWSRANAAAPPIPVAQGVAVGPYLIMPENGGIGVFAHEYAHSLGAIDLHAQEGGDPSAGFWTIMADDWTGYPAGFEPPAMDPLHLDQWGWLDPLVIDDPSREYVFKLGQASRFPGGAGAHRGAKITLPDGGRELPAPIWQGAGYWWGGNEALANGRMTLRAPIFIPAGTATLTFETAYRMRAGTDFLWVQASEDGVTWTTLTNSNTTCEHAADWIGARHGFPDDLCAAGVGGFTGANPSYPAPDAQVFDLGAFRGKAITLRFWHMTDAGAPLDGPFVDGVRVGAADVLLLYDDAEGPDTRWAVEAPWRFSNGARSFTQNYYLQWRNVSSSGGYDSALGDPRWRFGPANGGLLIWANNNYYTDNEIMRAMRDYPGFGPKGKLLVVDAHSVPYRDPGILAAGYPNEGANLSSRGQMRDAPFSLTSSTAFRYPSAIPGSTEWVEYAGRPAVGAFHDAFGYYPGAEFVIRGPGHSQSLPRWITRQWDASAVVPAASGYGMRAPLLRHDSPLLYRCRPTLSGSGEGLLNCYTYQFGLGYAGGSGNPGDFGAQYGWHVEILDQSDGVATVRVWNAQKSFGGQVGQTASLQPAIRGAMVSVDIQATNTGSPADALFIAPLDDEEEYVGGSAYGGAYPVTAAEAKALPALAAAAASSAPGEVVAVAARATLATAGAARFGFSTRITADSGEIAHSVTAFEGATFVGAFGGAPLPIARAAQTVTDEFGASADAHISRGISRTNFGQWPFIYIGANDVLRSLLRFDVSSIDPRYPIDAATLAVFVESFGGGGSPAKVAGYQMVTPWQERTVTWTSPWRSPGGDAGAAAEGLTSITKAAVGRWVEIDVTEMARKWVANPAGNNGALLRLVDATSFTTYRLVSRNNGWMRERAPKLRITYRKP